MPSLIYQPLQSDPEVARTLSMILLVVSVGDPGGAAQPMADRAVTRRRRPARRRPGRRPARRAASRPRAGEVVAVIGPNGAGKTTLLRAAGRAGRRRRHGRGGRRLVDPAARGWCATARVGFVFQDQSLFPHLSALDNVAFGPARARRRPGRGASARPRGLAGPVRRRRPGRAAGPASSPAARPSGSRSPGRWPPSPRCCCSTSRSPGSTSGSRPRCGSSWPATSRRTTGSRCWSPTTPSTRSPSPTGCWCSTRAGSRRPGTPQRGGGPAAHRARGPAGRAQRDPRGRRASARSAPARSPSRSTEPDGLGPAPLARAGAERRAARRRRTPAGRRRARPDRRRDPGGRPPSSACPGSRRLAVGEGDRGPDLRATVDVTVTITP